jgi:hypothetical protein
MGSSGFVRHDRKPGACRHALEHWELIKAVKTETV